MLKFIAGPLLVGAGYAAGSYYGSDAEQIVHKSPSITYAAIDDALAGMPRSGVTTFDGGAAVPYQIKVDRTAGEKLLVTLLFSGQPGAEADMEFAPQNDGKDTLIKARLHAQRDVLRTALAGTDKARLAYAPEWMLNLTFKPLLKQLAGEIERGETARFSYVSEGEAEANWESNLSADQRGEVAQWRQYEATRPSVDPNAAAQNYTETNSN